MEWFLWGEGDMIFTSEKSELKWHKWFAFFPVKIGEDNGRDVKVWLEFYEYRYPYAWALHRRRVNAPDYFSFSCTE